MMSLVDSTSKTAVGALSPLSLGCPSPSLHPHSPSLHAHSSSLQPPSPSEEWRRCAEAEVNKERRRVDKLVGVTRTFDVNLEAQAQGGQNDRGHWERRGKCRRRGKFSYAFHVLAANKLV